MDNDEMQKTIEDLIKLRKQIEKKIKGVQNEPPEIREAKQKLLKSYKHHITPVSGIIKLHKLLGKSGPQVTREATKHIVKGILKQINALVEAQIQSDSEMDEKYGSEIAVSADDPDTYKAYQITAICYAMVEALAKIGVNVPDEFTELLDDDFHSMAFGDDNESEDEDEDSEEEGLLSSNNPFEDESEKDALENDPGFQDFKKNYEGFESKFFPFWEEAKAQFFKGDEDQELLMMKIMGSAVFEYNKEFPVFEKALDKIDEMRRRAE